MIELYRETIDLGSGITSGFGIAVQRAFDGGHRHIEVSVSVWEHVCNIAEGQHYFETGCPACRCGLLEPVEKPYEAAQ